LRLKAFKTFSKNFGKGVDIIPRRVYIGYNERGTTKQRLNRTAVVSGVNLEK
jgi:hypothetical protein